jgi:hypothetical protein
MERASSKITNPLLPSIVPQDVLQLTVAGEQQKVRGFWEYLKSSPAYRLTTDLHMVFDNLVNKGNMHIVLQLLENVEPRTDKNQAVSMVQIRDQHGQNILFTLLDAQIVEMLDGVIFIHGTNYDIFADPVCRRRESVEIEEIESKR